MALSLGKNQDALLTVTGVASSP